ncbi:hypothetical protein HYH03_000163 [Edaphochlamys debaryana]|uniref:Uncharacterized protein n=1 Tax=Edaphochlamys debaryana TaxID=47281 RepID=A0A835YF29_9CHLO|nr:hypothetical protein HYH03_000163 [Edaphochlamys debaryana]|eukprot:KAG2501660.1 hypothetical protein HYH03_000163 [Edaphochlamys debaryana]
MPSSTHAQFNIHFGSCHNGLQRQDYMNWDMYRLEEQPDPQRLVLYLYTYNKLLLSPAVGKVVPANFTVSSLYFAYGDHRASVKDRLLPRPEPYRVEIYKVCQDTQENSKRDCAAVSNPSAVFPVRGYVVWSAWSVSQTLVINGVTVGWGTQTWGLLGGVVADGTRLMGWRRR